MFDDISEQENGGPASGNLSGTTNPIAGNGPQINQSQNNVNSGAFRQAPLEDIFAETNKEEKPLAFQPKINSNPQISGLIESDKSDLRKLMLLCGLLLSFVCLCLFGYWGFNHFTKSTSKEFSGSGVSGMDTNSPLSNDPNLISTPAVPVEQKDEQKQKAEDSQPAAAIEPTATNTITNQIESATTSQKGLDTDQDGLMNEEEMSLGTNINSVDSDNDGLFDMEEVRVYKTDPLNPDTDGDGYLDGEEVKSGYNPNGPGKLTVQK